MCATTKYDNKINSAGGRPPKFSEPRRPITVTLPERILVNLESISRDRARAIVKCVEAVAGDGNSSFKPVELIEVLPGKALIIVGSIRLLKQIKWLRLMEITPARWMLVIPSGTPIEALEIEIQDLLDKMKLFEKEERRILVELRALLAKLRRQDTVSKAELLFVETSKKTARTK